MTRARGARVPGSVEFEAVGAGLTRAWGKSVGVTPHRPGSGPRPRPEPDAVRDAGPGRDQRASTGRDLKRRWT